MKDGSGKEFFMKNRSADNSSEDIRICKNRFRPGMFGPEPCMMYEMDGCDARDISCSCYEPETEEDYPCTPSSTAGDYGPGNPWDAPGMSIRDFI